MICSSPAFNNDKGDNDDFLLMKEFIQRSTVDVVKLAGYCYPGWQRAHAANAN
jgi:hypothetical protein